MTLPGGEANLTIPSFLPNILFPKSGTGYVQTLSGAYDLIQSFVENALKQQYVLDNPAINNPLSDIFAGLRAGPGISLALAIIEAIVNRFLPWLPDIEFPDLDGALQELSDFVTNLFGAFGGSTGLPQMQNFLTNLLALLDNPLLTGLPGLFDPDSVWIDTIGNIINPLGMLAQLVGGVLPDSQKPNWLQLINDNIHNAYANFGEPIDLNTNPLEVLNSILGVFQTGRSASAKISGLDARVLALEGGAGPSIVLDFNGAAATLVSMSSSWNIIASGGGAGGMAIDGSGSLKWSKSGSSSRTEQGRYLTSVLAADNGIIETVLSSTTQTPSSGSATPYTYVNFRMNNTGTSYTRLLIGSNEIRLQYVNGGTVTNITPDIGSGGHPKSGDSLKVTFGDAAGANPLHFTVSVNGAEVHNAVASAGPASGASNRHVGVGMTTGSNGDFFFPTQMNPAGLAVVTFAEVL